MEPPRSIAVCKGVFLLILLVIFFYFFFLQVVVQYLEKYTDTTRIVERVETIENSSSYIFAWTKDENGWDSEFLAVINANPKDKNYGSLIKTLPVGYNNLNAHHSEHRFHESKTLFTNGFMGGRSFIFNLEEPKWKLCIRRDWELYMSVILSSHV